MSDVILAAAITAGVALAGNVTAVLITSRAERRRSEADSARLLQEHLEADRRVRRDAYQRLLNAIEDLDAMTSHYVKEPTRETFEEWLREFRAAGVQVRLVESQPVHEARNAYGRVITDLAEKMQARVEANAPSWLDTLGEPYVELQPKFAEAAIALANAMRTDLAFAPE